MADVSDERLAELIAEYEAEIYPYLRNRETANALRELLALRSQARDEWQPIETAPRGGTSILVWAAGYNSPFAVMWGNAAEELGELPVLPEGSVIGRDWLVVGGESLERAIVEPTHWTPLKAAPDSADATKYHASILCENRNTARARDGYVLVPVTTWNKYAWHNDDCDAIYRAGELRYPLVPCSCGFNAALGEPSQEGPT